MAARSQGQVVERDSARGTVFSLRFVAQGKRRSQTLGTADKGWTRARAERELENVLADVRRDIWQPPAPKTAPSVVTDRDPDFHTFASEWFGAHRGEWRETTQEDYQWQLSNHLLPFFRNHRLSQITIAEVDRYRTQKVKTKLSATSINKTITRLAQILETAVEYGMLSANPAKGVRRRLKASRPAPVWLDSAQHISALLDAAGELDRGAKSNGRVPRRALLATLTFAGLRLGELTSLRWRDVDLATGWLTVRGSKTDAGMRRVELLPVLREELATLRASTSIVSGDALVFPTQRGETMNPSNVRNRILAKAATLANAQLEAAGATPLPDGLTPHKLRHSYCSLLAACGYDPPTIMASMGHSDASFTLRVYAHGMRRDGSTRAELRALVGLDGPRLVADGQPDLVSGTNSGTNVAASGL